MGEHSRAPETFTTARLVARRVTLEDQPFLASIWQDPTVTATLGGPRDAGQVAAMLGRMVDHWERRGFGVWILRDRVSGEPLGWVGIHETDVGGPGGYELLYGITSRRWREGLATEAGAAAVQLAATALGLDELVCFTLVDNEGSRRTMEGLGFTYEGEVEHAGMPHVLTRRAVAREEASDRG